MTATGPMDTSLEVANNYGDIRRLRVGYIVNKDVHNRSSFQRRLSKDRIRVAKLRSEGKYFS